MPDTSNTKGVQFADLSLSDVMMTSLDKAGYQEPTPVQAGLIPLALDGVDALGQAQTGTGKTASFAIPILERLERRRDRDGPQALILVPTRELAIQVRGEVDKLSHGQKVGCVALYGGKPIRGQVEKLKRHPQIIVGTPGRVLDHIGRATLLLNDIRMVVLDEADRMLDIGFRPDIERILKRCPRERQTLLLSATIPPSVEKLARRYMRDPQKLDCSPTDIAVETIEQHYFTVDHHRKFELLVRLIQREEPQQAIIFCRTKRGTDRIHRRLQKRFPQVACIHGDLEQSARDRVMAAFRKATVRLLVATDVVGRGIDVTAISHIINYDVPQFSDDYVHRVGRTGRMGREGVAFTFVAPEEGNELTRIEIRINRQLKREEISGFETTGDPESPTATVSDQASPGDKPAAEDPAPPPPPSLRRGRGTRRHRRGL